MSCKKIISGWAGLPLPNLVHNVRNYNSLKLQEFYDHFMKLTNDLDSLKVLSVILQLNPNQCLLEEVSIALTATLCSGSSSNAIKVVCSHLLRASLPNEAIHLEDLPTCKETLLLTCMLVLEQGKNDKDAIDHYCSTILGWMSTSERNFQNKSNACKIIAQIAGHHLSIMKPEDADAFAHHLKQMLCFETQLPACLPNKTMSQLTQIDDTPSQHFVTVLSATSGNIKDLHTNVEAFSVLRQLWPIIFDHLTVTINDKPSPAQMALRNTVVDYCLRVIEQTERIPLRSGDDSIHQITLVESLTLLDLICSDEASTFVRIFPVIRRIYEQTTSLNVAVCALQIFLHQSIQTKYDPQAELKKFFTTYVPNSLTNLGSSFEVVHFLRSNLGILNSTNPSPLRSWFPSIFQILAWHPMTFLEEFLEFVPTFMNDATTIEVLHCILDLPCLSATMMRTRNYSAESKLNLSRPSAAQFKAMYDFICRNDSGNGETIDGLHLVHQELQDNVKHLRVVVAADCVVPMLEVYFEVVNQFGDEKLAEKLLTVILERSSLIYPVPNLMENIQRLFSEITLDLMKRYPQLVGTLKMEITEFLSNGKQQAPDLRYHLIWVIGQYTSPAFWTNSTLELIRSYYDTMECLLYEHLSSTPHRMVSVTIATMVKLASRCQDLVPRVLLGLSKVIQFSQGMGSVEWTMVASRAEEFVAMLGEPNVATMALSPSIDSLSGRLHCDSYSLPALWRATSAFISAPFQSQLH